MNRPGAHIDALVGHLVDFYRLATFSFSNPHSYSKFRAIKSLAKKTGATTFVETGTYRGVTAARCARLFKRVYTVELDAELARNAAQYLARWGHVEVVHGDGVVELPRLLARPEVEDVLVFLDGHFSGGVTAHGRVAEPACEEIELLSRFKDKIRGVIIDDFRCFGTDAGWPRKSDLLRSVELYFEPDFHISVHLDQLLLTRAASPPSKQA